MAIHITSRFMFLITQLSSRLSLLLKQRIPCAQTGRIHRTYLDLPFAAIVGLRPLLVGHSILSWSLPIESPYFSDAMLRIQLSHLRGHHFILLIFMKYIGTSMKWCERCSTPVRAVFRFPDRK